MNIFDEMDKAISEFFAAADDFIKNEKDIRLVDGKNTDLHIDGLVFDIELGERIR